MLKNQQGQVFREIAATGETVLVTNPSASTGSCSRRRPL